MPPFHGLTVTQFRQRAEKELCEVFLFCYEQCRKTRGKIPTAAGLGLGSQVSQIAAIALPNKIDHYIKDVLRMKFYERYMDDGLIISRSKEKLRECLEALRRLCAEHGIKLNEKKTQIIKLTRGFTFLKVRFRYGKTGAVVRRASYKSVRQMRKKLKIFRRWVDSGRMEPEDVRASLTSWSGYMRRFHSYFAVQSVMQKYRELFAA